MMVRLLQHWKGWKPGRILADMPDGQANLLIRRKVAAIVEPEPEVQQAEIRKPAKVKRGIA